MIHHFGLPWGCVPDLGGAAKLRAMDVPVRTLMSFEGH
jgi:adenine phosphoribosyltransferase